MKMLGKIIGVALAAVLIVSCAILFTSSEVSAKYVSESEPITFGYNVLTFGDDFSYRVGNMFDQGELNRVIFGYANSYPDIWDENAGVIVDCAHDGSIRAYRRGNTAYILSNKTIYAHPWSTRLLAGDRRRGANPYNPKMYYVNSVDFSNFDTSFMAYSSGMFQGSDITHLDISHWNVSRLKDTSNMFNDCLNLTDLKINWSNTTSLHSIQEMFWNCTSLTELDLSNWKTATVGVRNGDSSQYYALFWGCTSLKKVDLSNWDFSNATNATQMFMKCSSLETIDMSGWKNTSGIERAYQMFNECTSLRSIDMSNLDTSGLAITKEMFKGCTNLTTVNMTGCDLSSLQIADSMFAGCRSLTTIKGIESWNTANIGSFESMFSGCSSLTELDLSKWVINCSDDYRIGIFYDWQTNYHDSKNDLANMFSGCTSLQKLNLTGWDASNVHNVAGMFNGCSSLTTIFASANADWSGISNSSNMFAGCTSLSGDYTAFDAANVNALYARADDPASGKPGYFTAGIAQPTPLAGQMALRATQSIVDDQQMITLTYDAAAIPEGYAFAGWYVDKGKGTELCSEQSTYQFVLTEENKDWKWTIGLKKATEGGGQ